MSKRPHPSPHDGDEPNEVLTTIASRTSQPHRGYGNIHPNNVRNVFTRGQRVPFIVRWQKVMTIDFTQSLLPTIIPYHLFSFWTGAWDHSNTQNLRTFAGLLKLALGMTIHHSDLTIELYTITRERLLQQGATNVTTFDFEDRQYLYITRADRDFEIYQISSLTDISPRNLRVINNKEFHYMLDTYTRIAQLPPNMTLTHRFTWPQLDHNYI
jgi:hypothetical protein